MGTGSEKGRESKIAGRRKRRAEKREGRKEGRTRASRRSGRRTHRSQAGQARNLSLSPSFSFDPRPHSLRASRASQSLALLSLSPAPALARGPSSPLLITLHGPPAEPPFALFSPPRTAAHHLLSLALVLVHPPPVLHPHARHPHPSPPQAALLAVTTRSPPPDKDKLRCIFRAPKSSNVLHHRPRSLPPPVPSRHLRPRSSSTSFHGTRLLRRPTILAPLSSSLPRLPPTDPPGL